MASSSNANPSACFGFKLSLDSASMSSLPASGNPHSTNRADVKHRCGTVHCPHIPFQSSAKIPFLYCISDCRSVFSLSLVTYEHQSGGYYPLSSSARWPVVQRVNAGPIILFITIHLYTVLQSGRHSESQLNVGELVSPNPPLQRHTCRSRVDFPVQSRQFILIYLQSEKMPRIERY